MPASQFHNLNSEPALTMQNEPPPMGTHTLKQWDWEPHDSVLEQLEEMSRRHSEVARHEDPMRKRELFGVHLRAKKKHVKLA